MDIPGLTAATIREHATEESFLRGEDYFNTGAVVSLEREGKQKIEAHVKGGHYLPYTVEIEHDDAGITDVACTCPYHAGSWCKHIVATLLACLHQEQQETPVAVLLDGLDRAALVGLVERLVEREPGLADWIAQEAARLR